jgi:hypothetical protein
MAAVPQINTNLWLYSGFAAEQVNMAEYPEGRGFGVRMTLATNEVNVVFGATYGVLPLNEQEAAARKTAEIFTRIADRLAKQSRREQDTDAGTGRVRWSR